MKLGSFLLELSRENVCCFCPKTRIFASCKWSRKEAKKPDASHICAMQIWEGSGFCGPFPLLISESETKKKEQQWVQDYEDLRREHAVN